jgi:hypothetical protein
MALAFRAGVVGWSSELRSMSTLAGFLGELAVDFAGAAPFACPYWWGQPIRPPASCFLATFALAGKLPLLGFGLQAALILTGVVRRKQNPRWRGFGFHFVTTARTASMTSTLAHPHHLRVISRRAEIEQRPARQRIAMHGDVAAVGFFNHNDRRVVRCRHNPHGHTGQ